MLKHTAIYSRSSVRLLLGISLVISLVALTLSLLRKPHENVHKESNAAITTSPDVMPQLQGAKAAEYLEAKGESQSLAKAVTNARFGLQWHKRSPFGDEGSGYLALSHDQDLNAWFDETGVTIRSTTSNAEQVERVRMQLKALGYGARLTAAPPIAERSAEGDRIEYRRNNSEVIEWYENRSGGIEQGFTINRRPERENGAASEPLRIVVSLAGDLHARVRDEGQTIQFVNATGSSVMTYSKLIAKDAQSRSIACHLETNANGDEIALVIEDHNAVYPLVVDPITATEEARLFALSIGPLNAFGGDVAISGNIAVVGAWGEDFVGSSNAGAVYVFVRSGSTWSFELRTGGSAADLRCGWSVAIEGNFVAWGCPGSATISGKAFLAERRGGLINYAVLSLNPPEDVLGDAFGWSVAISGNKVIVGAPNYDTATQSNAGAAFVFNIENFNVTFSWRIDTPSAGNDLQFGYSVDIADRTVVIGQPLTDVGPQSDAGAAFVFRLDNFAVFRQEAQLMADDALAIDHFGLDVAISGDTVAVGSPLDDNIRGIDAGSIYVFVRGTNAVWTQQQKLIASDGFANDQFSAFAIDIQDNTLVAGAYRNDYPHLFFSPNEDSGEAYVFTRNASTWSEQARFRASDGSPSDLFGIAIAISGDTVIVGAQNDDVNGFSDAGSAYVYRLSCIAGPRMKVGYFLPWGLNNNGASSVDICQGQRIVLTATDIDVEATYHWRKNGVDIPGATSFDYEITAANTSDQGVYEVVKTTSCLTQTSFPIAMNVSTDCRINPSSQHFPRTGGTGTVDLTACATCVWDIDLSLAGIYPVVSFDASYGQGNRTLTYSVSPNFNTAGALRATIAGKPFTIMEDGLPNITVSSTGNGPGSLRIAIVTANSTPEDDLITFDIPGPGPHTIDLTTPLPTLTSNISIVNDRPGDRPVIVRRSVATAFRIFTVNPNKAVLIAGLTVKDGSQNFGGGIYNAGALTVRNSTIQDNASNIGGGIFTASGASSNIRNCSFISNSSSGDGSAVFGADDSIVNVVNSTFAGNSTGLRGAVCIQVAHLSLINNTFSLNSSASGGGSLHNIGGIVDVGNTIFKRGLNENIVSENGTFTSLGHNLSDDAAGGDAGVGPGGLLNRAGDIRNTNTGLGALTNNGGPTLTLALLDTSPAINAGDDNVLGPPSSLFSDQRGFARKTGSHVDIGAFEYSSVPGSNFVQFSAPLYNVSEGARSATITVNRTGDTSGRATVEYAATVGSYVPCNVVAEIGTQNCDYIISSGTLTFGPSETTKSFDVLIIDDAYVEGNEKLSVTLSNATGAAVGSIIAAPITITDNDSTTPTSNPIDAAQFFVREHYYDFLSRLPDQGGLDYWSSQITGCGADAACVNSRRTGVSAAYFIELEFQQTGYVVYRIHRAALGTLTGAPNRANLMYQQFMPDRSQLVAGPQLPQSTLDFANRFVQRPEFLSKYPSSMTNTQFVNTLFDTAGLTPFTAERQQAINAMNGGRTRAQVILDVIEIPEFKTREYNPAFVLMQYYGYLRRDPEQGGYDFWLDVLNNRVPGNFLGMVCAFITSTEYQQRFSPVVTRSNSACGP